MMTWSRLPVLVVAVLMLAVSPAAAWDRGQVDTLAVLPAGSTAPEGLTVGPDGHVYVTTSGFTSQGAVSGTSQLFVIRPDGALIRHVPIQHSTPHVLGLEFNPVTGALIVLDFGAGVALQVDPLTGQSAPFMLASTTGVPDPETPGTDPAQSGLNGLTFDAEGNAYIADSFQGLIWTAGKHGGSGAQRLGTIWVAHETLTTDGFPPFGANGVEFNHARTLLFATNTGNRQVIAIPVNPDGSAGTPRVFVNSINGADGLRIDADDNLWVCANQEDEIVVLDPTGKVIAKLGDFEGVDQQGVPHGLLVPASPAFSRDGQGLYVTNLALDFTVLPLGLTQAIDSPWAREVTHYTVAKLRARIPPIPRASD
jgi:sugar lactone lactonase YvrE